MRALRAIAGGVRDFFRDDGLMLSSHISFSLITAFVPFCLLMLSVLGHFLGGHEDFNRFLIERVSSLFPRAAEQVTEEVKKLIAFRGLGKFTLLLYAVLSYQLFYALERATGAVFKSRRRRSFITSIFMSLTAATIVMAMLLLSFALSSIVPLVRALKPYAVPMGLVGSFVIKYALPFLLVFSAFVSVYLILPPGKVRIRHALAGGAFSAVMLEAAKHAFAWYAGSVVDFGALYGSLAAFVVFLLWIYFASCLYLVGGEIVHNLGGNTSGRGGSASGKGA